MNDLFNNGEIIFSGRLDEDVKNCNVRVMRRGRAIKFFIFAFIAATISVLIYNVLKSERQDYISFLMSGGGVFGFVPLAVCVLCAFFAIKELVIPKNEKTSDTREYSAIFDKEQNTFSIQTQGQSATFPLDSIVKYTDDGKVFTIYYEVKAEEIKSGKKQGKKKAVDKLFALVCQKSLLIDGNLKEFTDLLDGVLLKRKAEKKERLSKIKSFGIAAIVLSLIAIAITYPFFMLGNYIINDYSGKIFDNFFDKFDGLEKLVAALFLGIFVCIYLVVVMILGFICYIAPIPLFLLALIFVIIQLVYNRKAISFVALTVFILSLAGYIALLSFGAVF